MPPMARLTSGGGGASSRASGKRRRMRARVANSDASGSCTAATPPGPQAMAQSPMAVSKTVKPAVVMAARNYHPAGRARLQNLAPPALARGTFASVPLSLCGRGAKGERFCERVS